jgi:hypothetical protein
MFVAIEMTRRRRKTCEMASKRVEGCLELELQAIKLFHDILHLAPFTQYITHLQTTPQDTLKMGMLLSDDPDDSTGKRRDASWLDCQQNSRDALSHMIINEAVPSDEEVALLTNSVKELKGLYVHSFDTWPDDVLVDRPQATEKMKEAFSDLDAKVKTLGTQPSDEATEDVQSAFKTVDEHFWEMPTHNGRTKGSVAANSLPWPRKEPTDSKL